MFTGNYDISRRTRQKMPADPGDPPILQIQWEFESLLGIVKNLDPRNVLEIGSYRGGTLRHFMGTCSPGSRFVAICLQFEQSVADIWAAHCEHGCSVINGRSQDTEVRSAVVGIMPEIDFLFIDGDHHYQPAREDFEFYGKLVRPGGIIAFHDIQQSRECPELEVWRLWDDIRQAGYMTQELVTSRIGAPGGIGVVYISER